MAETSHTDLGDLMADDDDAAPVEETNFYKQDLADAKIAISDEVEAFSGVGGPSASITQHVAGNGGWECTEADTWVQDVSTRCSAIVTAFQTALDDVEAEWSSQPDKVHEGNWRGLAYQSR